MNIFDIVIIIPLLWGLYKGIRKGLIIEIATLAALVLGIWGGMHFSNFTASKIESFLDINSSYLPLISFAVTFIGIVIIVHLLARIIEKLIKAVALGFVNTLGGALAGIAKFGCIVSIAILLIDRANSAANFIDPTTLNESLLYYHFLAIAEFLVGKANL